MGHITWPRLFVLLIASCNAQHWILCVLRMPCHKYNIGRTCTEILILHCSRPSQKHGCYTSVPVYQYYGSSDKKLSYCRGTVRHAMLVNLCYVSLCMGARKVLNSKSDLQGHSRALAMVPFNRPHRISYWTSIIAMSIMHCFRDTVTYFQKLKEVTWPWTHPFRW